MSDHKIEFRGGWRLWRSFVLRGAGFPATDVFELSAPKSALAVDSLLAMEREFRAAIESAIDVVGRAEIKPSIRKKSIRQLRELHIPKRLASIPETAESHVALTAAAERIESARSALSEVYAEEQRVVGDSIAAIVARPRFREAVIWQNPSAAKRVFERLAGAGSHSEKKRRRDQRLVANYLQRYCVKNDTIGFFGPVLWARFSEETESVSVPGRELLSYREVLFEDWAALALASKYSRSPEILSQVAPRLSPTVRPEGATLHVAGGESQSISAALAQVLRSCDGRPAAEIAAELSASQEWESADEVYDVLEALTEQGALIWELQVPGLARRPLRQLHSQLSEMTGSAAAQAMAELDRLERYRIELEAAAGNPKQVARANEALCAAFEGATGVDSDRAHGQMYAGRTPVYEECIRSHETILGRDFLEPLAPALSCVLASARWFCHRGAVLFRTQADAVYERLVAESGDTQVELLDFVSALPQEDGEGLTGRLVRELREKWDKILGSQSLESAIEVRTADIEGAVEREFAAPGHGWPSAVFQAPDIMLAAGSLEAALRGERLFVLGELHAGTNSITAPSFARWHDNPMDLAKGFEDDVGPVFFEPAPLTDGDGGMAKNVAPTDCHYQILVGKSPSSKRKGLQLAIADLFVEERDSTLSVFHRQTGERFDLVAVLETQLRAAFASDFSAFSGRAHSPRVQIDELVLSRESWTFRADDFPRLPKASGVEQYVAIRRWAHAHGLPRLVFYKSKEETKPVYLDLDSPISTEIFATILRKSSELKISEMLPTPEQSWLADGDGNRYTSEIRLIATDHLASIR